MAIVTTLACVAGGIVCETIPLATQAMNTPNTTVPMFRHLLPKIPEEVPIISEDYQMSQYEARNLGVIL